MPARPHHLITLFAALALTTSACTSTPVGDEGSPGFGHIHALEFSAEGDLLVASHRGVYTVDVGDGSAELVGEADFDAMGMAVTGDAIVASGHPGLQSDDVFVAPNIGLVRHTPTTSWESVALAGQTDFHGLATTPANDQMIIGLPTDRPTLAVSQDAGVTWSDAADLQAREVIIDAAQPETIVATTAAGLLISQDAGATFNPLDGAPLLVVIASDDRRDGGVIGIDTNQVIWAGSSEEPASFEQIGRSTGTPAAIAANPATGAVAVADDRGIVVSTEDRTDWEVLLPAD